MKIQPSTSKAPLLAGIVVLAAMLVLISLGLGKATGGKIYVLSLPLGALAIISLIEGIGLFIRRMVEHLTVDEKSITIQQGIFDTSHQKIMMQSVKNVRVNQSFFQRLVGTGNIIFYTTATSASPNDMIEFKEVGNPHIVHEEIWTLICGNRPKEKIEVIPLLKTA